MDQQQFTIQADQALKEITKVVESASLPKAQHVFLDQCLQAMRMIVSQWSASKDAEMRANLIQEAEKKSL